MERGRSKEEGSDSGAVPGQGTAEESEGGEETRQNTTQQEKPQQKIPQQEAPQEKAPQQETTQEKNQQKTSPETTPQEKTRKETLQGSARPWWVPVFFAMLGLAGGVFCLTLLRKNLYVSRGGLRVKLIQPTTESVRVDPTPNLFEGDLPVDTTKVLYNGWVWIPKTGKYVFAAHLRGKVQLSIDNKVLIRHETGSRRVGGHRNPLTHVRDLRKNQILVQRGWRSLKLSYEPPRDAGPGLRLLWQPPGRRGDPEYIDPSFLSASIEQPQSSGPDGPPLSDALIATAILLLFLLFFIFLFRAPIKNFAARLKSEQELRVQVALGLILSVTAFVVRMIDLGGAGQTWDEDVYFGAGRNYVQNLLALDFSEESWIWNLEHPPISKYIIGWASLWTESMSWARATGAFLGGVTVGAAFFAGKRLLGWAPALLGGLLLVFSPHLIGHSKIAGHETPSVLFFTLCVLSYLVTSKRLSALSVSSVFSLSSTSSSSNPSLNPPPSHSSTTSFPNALLILTGLLCGLAVSTRWLNGAVLFIVVVFFFIDVWPQMKKKEEKLSIHWGVLLVPVLMMFTTAAVWPRLWSHPVSKIAETFGHYPAALSVKEYFLGRYISPPPHYFITYFSAVVPAAALVAWALFFVAWLDGGGEEVGSILRCKRRRGHLVLFVWWLVPMLAGLAGPMKQDGIRYVLPALVPAALMSAEGARWFSVRLFHIIIKIRSRFSPKSIPRPEAGRDNLPPNSRFGFTKNRVNVFLACVLVFESVMACISIHPYYIDYYNAFWGGTEAVARKKLFEFSWWGEGLVPATEWINENAEKNASVALEVEARHVMVFRPDIKVINSPRRADFLVRAGDALKKPPPQGFKPVHAERAGTEPVVKVYTRTHRR